MIISIRRYRLIAFYNSKEVIEIDVWPLFLMLLYHNNSYHIEHGKNSDGKIR